MPDTIRSSVWNSRPSGGAVKASAHRTAHSFPSPTGLHSPLPKRGRLIHSLNWRSKQMGWIFSFAMWARLLAHPNGDASSWPVSWSGSLVREGMRRWESGKGRSLQDATRKLPLTCFSLSPINEFIGRQHGFQATSGNFARGPTSWSSTVLDSLSYATGPGHLRLPSRNCTTDSLLTWIFTRAKRSTMYVRFWLKSGRHSPEHLRSCKRPMSLGPAFRGS